MALGKFNKISIYPILYPVKGDYVLLLTSPSRTASRGSQLAAVLKLHLSHAFCGFGVNPERVT